jgi:hypothetical protein
MMRRRVATCALALAACSRTAVPPVAKPAPIAPVAAPIAAPTPALTFAPRLCALSGQTLRSRDPLTLVPEDPSRHASMGYAHATLRLLAFTSEGRVLVERLADDMVNGRRRHSDGIGVDRRVVAITAELVAAVGPLPFGALVEARLQLSGFCERPLVCSPTILLGLEPAVPPFPPVLLVDWQGRGLAGVVIYDDGYVAARDDIGHEVHGYFTQEALQPLFVELADADFDAIPSDDRDGSGELLTLSCMRYQRVRIADHQGRLEAVLGSLTDLEDRLEHDCKPRTPGANPRCSLTAPAPPAH